MDKKVLVRPSVDLFTVANLCLVVVLAGFIVIIGVKVSTLRAELIKAVFLAEKEIVPVRPSRGSDIAQVIDLPAQVYDAQKGAAGPIELFLATWEKPDTEAATDLPEFLNKYRLVGIMMDARPTAILEDMEMRQTLLLSEGQAEGGLVVEKIMEGLVIVQYNGREMKLVP